MEKKYKCVTKCPELSICGHACSCNDPEEFMARYPETGCPCGNTPDFRHADANSAVKEPTN